MDVVAGVGEVSLITQIQNLPMAWNSLLGPCCLQVAQVLHLRSGIAFFALNPFKAGAGLHLR